MAALAMPGRIATLNIGLFAPCQSGGNRIMKRIAFWGVLAAALSSASASAAVKTETVTYKVGDKTYKGFLAYDDASTKKRPGILVVHEFWGLDDYAKTRAKQLAELGYVAFAADMYGDGKVTEHPKEAGAMATEVRMNQKEWLARAHAGLKVLRDHPLVDGTKLGAIGYCFGGSTVLTLANTGAEIKAAVSFHGALPTPNEDDLKNVKAKILICHGAADAFIKEDLIQKVRGAYDKAGVDYQMIYYGGAVHSFTVPGADARKIPGIRYDAAADRRSWAAMRALFDEVFEGKK
jgi:dienelactone hydrolase